MLPIERKSVEPMAARLAPGNVRQMHQSLHHIVADAPWSDEALLKQVRRQVLPAMTKKHALAAWIVDDTGFPQEGYSFGWSHAPVLRPVGQAGELPSGGERIAGHRAGQYSRDLSALSSRDVGQRSRSGASKPACPRRFVSRPSRRSRWGISVRWSTRMCRVALFWPMPLMATIVAFAKDLYHWGFPTRLASSLRPRFGLRASCRCHPSRRAKWAVRRGCCGGMNSISRSRPKNSALCLSAADLRKVSWREGTRGMMRSRFAALRVRVAHRDYWRKEPHPEQWLLIEWPTERERADKILAVESARIDQPAQTGCHRQTALAHRARLRRTEAGTWPGTFRRAELARLSSPCDSVDRRLWLPGAGAVPFSPLRQLARLSKQETSRFKYPQCDPITRPEALPVRTERHNPHSIATLRRQIATHLARSLPRCPCCLRGFL